MNRYNLEDASWGATSLTLPHALTAAVSTVLSSCITDLSSIRSGALQFSKGKKLFVLVCIGAAAEVSSWFLAARHNSLSIDQLDVHATWLVETARFVPLRARHARRVATVARAAALKAMCEGVLPSHQLALAHLMYARAFWNQGSANSGVHTAVEEALVAAETETHRRENEKDQLLALRQRVRVLKTCGKIRVEMGDAKWGSNHAHLNLLSARRLLSEARDLAVGPAKTPSQVAQIDRLLKELKKKLG